MENIDRYWRAANYLSVAQIYLRSNPLLQQPLKKEHLKKRLLGHFGTSPGLNLIYAHLNCLIQKTGANVLYVTGPGHGGPALRANVYLEGVMTEVYPDLDFSLGGMTKLMKEFSWPGGVPSHVSPPTPGSIHEGGELGYALVHAYGAAFDNPDLIVACVVGDGEAETGPLAGSWQSNKFLNPARDGAVLPILHLNGYKISGPTIFGRMPDSAIRKYFEGLGYEPFFVEGDDPKKVHRAFSETLHVCYEKIRSIQEEARRVGADELFHFPMIVMRTPKGWTGPKVVDGKQVEGTFRAHQVPIADVVDNDEHRAILEEWLKSYRPEELFDSSGKPLPDVLEIVPEGDKRMGAIPCANGGALLEELVFPDFTDYAIDVPVPGGVKSEATRQMGKFVRDIMHHNQKNFRLFCPDETKSNRFDNVFEVTDRMYIGEVLESDESLSSTGRVMEVLSEHLCQGWLEGYLLSGRHGVFPCYEAFALIVDSMLNQHAKWLKACREIPWRKSIASLNYVLTSHAWRQDHNGYSHQGPGFIESVLQKKGDVARIYLPPDANCLLSVADHCFRSRDYVNLIVAGKQPMDQWLTMDAAKEHCKKGASVWEFASNGTDIVMASAGDTPTLEVMAAIDILRKQFPNLGLRMVNVVDLFRLVTKDMHPHGMSDEEFTELFTENAPIIFAFHGHPRVVHELTYRRQGHNRFHVRGYIEEGTTTTPFDMVVCNEMSRYHLVLLALKHSSIECGDFVKEIEEKLRLHKEYICEHGVDLPEIEGWRWENESSHN
jgi:xylulose-5-phosphate/fructose-6-phosphate phosphoketolase